MSNKKIKKPNEADDHSAPGSVYLAHDQLIRDDVSDLSGSFIGGFNNVRTSVPRTIYQEATSGGRWRQAYVASRLPPPRTGHFSLPLSKGRGRNLVYSRSGTDGSVEVIGATYMGGPLEMEELQKQSENRIPVTVLLMDGSKRTYELLQVWIDRTKDSVRSFLQAVQRGIPNEKWKTTYDGIFQVRGNRFTQLIHILQLSKYDIRPNEVFVAKPSSMTSKVVTIHANSAIRHLSNIQVITTDEEDRRRPKSFDSGPLLLSSAAQKRLYCPEGIQSHHHATQFLTFSPPFDVKFLTMDTVTDDVQSSQGSNVSSIGLTSIQGQMVDDLIASLRRSRQDTTTVSPEPHGPLAPPVEGSECSIVSRQKMPPSVALVDESRARRNCSQVVAQFNCFKTKQRVSALACCPQNENEDASRTGSRNKKLSPVTEDETISKIKIVPVDDGAPTLTGTEVEASMFYARCKNGGHIRLMEI